MSFTIGFLLFPEITQLDLSGPYEIFTKFPDTKVLLVSRSLEPVRANGGMQIIPDVTFSNCPTLDLICIPGGSGINFLLNDNSILEFIRNKASSALYVTSVCTGALVLGAAGLLVGKHATTHWMSREFLHLFGAIPVDARVVKDGHVITGGGVTAGIDFALAIAAELFGVDKAKEIQLGIEYDPKPQFDAGSPASAGQTLEMKVRADSAVRQARREEAVIAAAERLYR